jgi:hypothetical protein
VHGAEDDLLVLVDTGYNRCLNVAEGFRREARLPGREYAGRDIVIRSATEEATLADGSTSQQDWYWSYAFLELFGTTRRVDVMVWAREQFSARGGDIEGVIGREFFGEYELFIDFPHRSVEIKMPDL